MKTITMEKWNDGKGVDLRFQRPDHGTSKQMVSLNFAEVDKVIALLQEYQEHPNPFRMIKVNQQA